MCVRVCVRVCVSVRARGWLCVGWGCVFEECNHHHSKRSTLSHIICIFTHQTVVKGICLSDLEFYGDSRANLLRLWAHECARVYGDPLCTLLDHKRCVVVVMVVAAGCHVLLGMQAKQT